MSARRPVAVRVLVGALWLAASLGARTAGAQAPQPGDAVARADSFALAGDSARALALLDSVVKASPKDARAWDRRGVIAWAMARRDRSNTFIRDQKSIRLLMVADSSLRLATIIAPDSARYLIDLGKFFLNSNLASLRWQAAGIFDHALDDARRSASRDVLARAADEMGMIYWRRYEAVAHRYNMLGGIETPDLAQYVNDRKAAKLFVESFVTKVTGFPGEADYTRAVDLFREGRAASPNDDQVLRHYYMSLADTQRWEELRQAARERLARAPWDAWAWLADGLASHRMNDEPAAQAAFDSALVLLPTADRARFTRLSRLLRTSDSVKLASGTDEQRKATENLYWSISDPLWMTKANEHWIEFLSRVTYAELRWSSDDFGYHGADTDRGDIWIRYGPPPVQLGFPSSIVWMYADGTMFAFNAPPTWGTASLTIDSRSVAEEIRSQRPVSWWNVPVDRDMDSVAVQVAHFRATKDSSDVMVVADIPLDSLLHGLDVRQGTVDVDLQMLDNRTAVVEVRDSTRRTVSTASHDAARIRAWRYRVPDARYAFRVEAVEATAMRAARAFGEVSVPRDSGFAMSDLLVARSVAPRADVAPVRWSDFLISPSAGRVPRGEPVALLWETYALGDRDGSSQWRVSVTVQRRRKGAAAVVARIVGGVQEAIGRSGKNGDKVTLAFDRTAPARPVAVDYLSLDLAGSPPGSYTITVTVQDRVTGRQTSASRQVTIIE